MALKLDLTNADTSGGGEFDALPNGDYPATIKKTEMGKTKGGGKLPEGTDQVSVGFEIDEDAIPEHPEKGKKYSRWVFARYNLPDPSYENHDKIMGIFFNMVEATGLFTEEQMRDPGGFMFDHEDLQGQRVIVRLKQRTYTNAADEPVVTSDVKFVKSIGAPAELV